MASVSTTELLVMQTELRRSRRYRLRVPASFCWEGTNGVLQQGLGLTRDVSVLGVLITTELLPECGSHLELEICLPSLTGTENTMRLRGEGRVIRVERRQGKAGEFAAEVILQPPTPSEPIVLGPEMTQ